MLDGFHKITEVIWPPYRKKKKQEFLDRLQGLSEIQIKVNTPVGTTFTVTDENTGYVDYYFQFGPEEWVAWGTTPLPDGRVTRSFSIRELEMHLTELMRKADKKHPIKMIDPSCCIEICE